jgi:DNA-binding SARP family transcriptional activator
VRLDAPSAADAEGLLRQPKRIALLAYLVMHAHEGFCRRDQVAARFWPDSDDTRARNSLSQSLHQIRRSLGADVLISRGSAQVGVDSRRLGCDAVDFDALLREGRDEDALALYHGDFMDGLHVPDAAPELDHWMDGVRSRLRSEAAAAAVRLGEHFDATGAHEAAVHHFRRALQINPEDEAAVRRLIRTLASRGDRASAVALYEEHARRLEEIYGLEPGAETRALVASLRSVPTLQAAGDGGPPIEERPDETNESPVHGHGGPRADPIAPPSQPPPPGASRRRFAIAVGAVLLLASLVLSRALPGLGPRSAPPRVVALGVVEGTSTSDSLRGFGDLLATGLARISGLEVVSTDRMEEVRAGLGAVAEGPEGAARVARAAGASELVEARVSHRPGGGLRLDIRRRDLRRGTLRGGTAVEAENPTDLVDLAVEALARDIGAVAVVTRTDGWGASLPAYRLYQEGLRAYYAQDATAARRLFRAALTEDTAFAMAAYYASLLADSPERWDLHALAVRLSEGAPERERLLIRTTYAAHMQDPSSLDLAAELAARYPTEPDGHLQLGRARLWQGDFAGAIAPLRLVIHMDSLGAPAGQLRCRSCDAWELLAMAYRLQDSTAAVERVARERITTQPGAAALIQLAGALEFLDRTGEALDAAGAAEALQPGLDLTDLRTSIYTRVGDFDAVESALRPSLSSGNLETRRGALWGLIISLRHQGRFAEALDAARRYRGDAGEASAALPEAVVRYEMGDAAGAAVLFRAMADAAVTGRSPSLDGRHSAWALVHLATAVAASGDTLGLRVLEDSVRVLGGRSAYGRDRRLHHHVRGLRLRVAGRTEEAAEAFREALFSPVEGYVRTSLELADALDRLGRPAEALAVVRPALRGPVGASGLYATRTEFHALAGRSFEALGQPDSAAVYYRRALAAWEHADPVLHDRVADLRRRLAALPPT